MVILSWSLINSFNSFAQIIIINPLFVGDNKPLEGFLGSNMKATGIAIIPVDKAGYISVGVTALSTAYRLACSDTLEARRGKAVPPELKPLRL